MADLLGEASLAVPWRGIPPPARGLVNDASALGQADYDFRRIRSIA
jgi:hypothetical protein